MFKATLYAVALAMTLLSACGQGADPASDQYPGDRSYTLEVNGNTVSVPVPGSAGAHAPGDFIVEVRRDIAIPVESPAVHSGDSLVWSRHFPLGGGSVLVLTGVAGDVSRIPTLISMLEQSTLERWNGIRSVYLSDLSEDSLDMLRNDTPREAPLFLNHQVSIIFHPSVSESSLVVVDSLSFTGRTAVLLEVNPGVNGYLKGITGTVLQQSPDSWQCNPDSSGTGFFKAVFTATFPRNWYINDPVSLELLGRSRMNSALLGGRYVPVGEHPNRYGISVSVPEGMRVYTPITTVSTGHGGTEAFFSTGSDLVRGVVPVFMGDFESSTLSDGRSRLMVQTGLDSVETAADSLWADNLGSLLQSMLGFPGNTFSIIVADGASESFMVPYHGCLVVSPGVLTTLSGVFSWGDSLAAGSPATGAGVVAAGAECFTLQSIFIDPVLSEAIQTWMPLRFLDHMSTDEDLFRMRRAYRNYYLYQTCVTGGTEPALADPGLASSTLRDPVVRGKGPCVLEYLYFQGCLDYLPNLLDNFRHSGSYWNKIWANLGLYEGGRQYRLLRQFLYQPGIPQILVEWWTEDGLIRLSATQMQPSAEFSITYRTCKLFLEGGLQRHVILNPGDGGVLYAVLPPEAFEGVLAIDLNPDELVPADFVYRRRVL
ncbi:MAG: hypothetical protein R6V62_06855 [Candidatus Fermentibacteraceae bacterium]